MASTRNDARFSTYSGAPSLQPSLAPTFESSARNSHTTSTYLSPKPLSEKRSSAMYGSCDPLATTSSSTVNSADPKAQDIKSWSGALERMQDERLDKQRYVMSPNKGEEVSKLALGAKVERALSRRMVGQDATFKVKVKKGLDEKRSLKEVEAR